MGNDLPFYDESLGRALGRVYPTLTLERDLVKIGNDDGFTTSYPVPPDGINREFIEVCLGLHIAAREERDDE